MRTTSTGSSMIASLDRKHYDYREQQEYQRKGTYLGYEVLAIPALSFPSCEDLLGSQARDERDSEINSYAFRNFAYGHINDSAAHSKPSGQQRHEYERVERKEKHLEDGIERDQSSAVVASPSARSFHTITIAMHRARPMMMRPVMYSGRS